MALRCGRRGERWRWRAWWWSGMRWWTASSFCFNLQKNPLISMTTSHSASTIMLLPDPSHDVGCGAIRLRKRFVRRFLFCIFLVSHHFVKVVEILMSRGTGFVDYFSICNGSILRLLSSNQLFLWKGSSKGKVLSWRLLSVISTLLLL